jgi:AAA family ATP:ADP antiporter
VDPWGVSLKYLMGAIMGCGTVMLGLFSHMQRNVLTDPACVDQEKQAAKKKKKKVKMTLKESAKFLMDSPYIRDLALLVISYGMCINIVEVSWKAKLKVRNAMDLYIVQIAKLFSNHFYVCPFIGCLPKSKRIQYVHG